MKKGFTLIELLAVIIILAVVALITTPTILDVVENAKEKSRISSVNSLINATRLYMSEALLDDSIDLSGNLLDIINNRVKGTKPSEGEIKINGNDIGIAVKIDGVCYSKYYTSDEIRKTNDSDCFIALEASDYVMTAFDAVINYEECIVNLKNVLETSYTEEELDKICKNELEVEGEITLKEIILYYYFYENQEYISLFEETNIAKIGYIKEKGYEKCFEYEGINGSKIDDFDINNELCMEDFEDEDICNGGKADFEETGNLMTLKEYIKYISSLDDEIFDELIDDGFIENIKYSYSDGIRITNYLCHASNNLILNKTGLPVVSDVVIPTTINGNKVIEIADVVSFDGQSSFAFRKLTSIDFNNARYLEKIGDGAFVWSNYGNIIDELDLSSLTNLKSIGESAFVSLGINSLKLPDNLISIGDNAFDGNQLPDDQAFIYKRIDSNGDGIAEIDNTVLVSYGGANTTDIVFPSNIKEINGVYCVDCFGTFFKGTLDLSQTQITEIKQGQFMGMGNTSAITSVKFPKTLEKIGNISFMFNQISGELDLSNLTNLTSVSGFGYNQITSVKIPSSVTEISSNAFFSNPNLTLIEIDNVKDAIEGAPWGADNAIVKWLRDSE